MDGYIVGSMISANSITGEQIQANSIKTANLELSVQKKIQDATDEETVKALIKADLDGFESTLSKEFVTVENAATQIQQATEVAVKEATQNIIDNAVSESMGAVDGQLNDKLNQYTSGTLLPTIAEKAEEVLQNAEDYVVTQLESYATKQELSSSISQTREQIELSVSEKYTTKAESATIITEAIDGITVGAINRVFGTGENKSFKFNGGANETWLPYKFSNDISDKEVFVSFKYTLTGTAQSGSQIEFAPSYLKKTNNQTVYRPKHIFFTSNRLQDVNITDTVSFTTKDFQDISPSSTSYIRFVGNGFTGTLSVSEVQIKQGNSKTSWSPAPEDTITDITNAKNDAIGSANNTLIATIANYYTKSETDSAISVAKDEINLGVSGVYETKANVETKVSSTLNSAKSYADTKKTEAINSANSTLSTTIQNYYTKTETNSQINIAKNAITQSVSSTYATKSDVNSSINGVNSSISNLQTRMNTAESKITDNAITNTVKKNFYTKTETENVITSKGYATQSQVQQTANDITFKFSQSGGYNLIRNGGFENGVAYWSKNNNPGITENQVWQNYHGKSIFISATAHGSGIYQHFSTVPGKIYSYSFYAQAEYGIWWAGVENRHTQNIEVSPNNWRRYTGTFTATNNSHAFICYAHGNGRNVFLDNVIVCEGALPSEYTPHPSEIYDGITTIDKSGVKVYASNMNGYTHMTEYGLYVNKDGKDLVSVDRYGLRLFDAKIQLTHANGNKYFLLDENGIIMYNPANGTHQWGKVAAINNKFTVASNGNSSGLSLGHHVNENYVEDILCDSNGVVSVQRQINHNGVFYNNYGQMFVRQSGQGGWEITGRSDSQSIKPGGANQGAVGSNTQYINQSWIANRYNPSSLEIKHLSHYVDDLECLKLVSEVQPARYFYKEYDEDGNDITTFTTKTSQLGLIYEDVRECSGRDLLTNEEDKAINSYGMVSVLWGAVRNLNERLNKLEYENALLNDELQNYKQKEGND